MLDEDDFNEDTQFTEKEKRPFQYQLMEWCLTALTIVCMTAFFIMIVF